MKFQHKPTVIEAFQYGVDEQPEWFNQAVKENKAQAFDSSKCKVLSNRGWVNVINGDFIIKGKNELYPCSVNVFEASYTKVDNPQEGGSHG